MITAIKNIKIFKADELSNDDYHGERFKDYSSGSELWSVFKSCPFEVAHSKQKNTAALHFGTATHSAILEPAEFDKYFVKSVCKDDFELKTDADIKSKLKELGQTGYTKLCYNDLVSTLLRLSHNSMPYSLAVLLQQIECDLKGQTIVSGAPIKHQDGTTSPSKYDSILDMRSMMFHQPKNVELLSGADVELSIFAEVEINGSWHKVKCRPDVITKDKQVPDYKTTRSIEPIEFGKQSFNLGYYFKMAFTLDIVNWAMGGGYRASLLAQSVNAPFLTQKYNLTEKQIEVGREQYASTLEEWTQCKEQSNYTGYYDSEVDLVTPNWAIKQYEMED